MNRETIERVFAAWGDPLLKDAMPETYQLELSGGPSIQFSSHTSSTSEPKASPSTSEAGDNQDLEVPTYQAEDEDGGDDWPEDDEEEGPEHCPICGAESDWGSTKTCEHFIGMLFDSSSLECRVLNSLNDAWMTLDRLGAHYNGEVLWALARRRKVDYEAFNLYMRNRDELVGDLSPHEVLDRASGMFGLRTGSLTTTGGMLGGSAMTIYAENPDFLHALDADLWGLANEIEDAHKEYRALQTSHQ